MFCGCWMRENNLCKCILMHNKWWVDEDRWKIFQILWIAINMSERQRQIAVTWIFFNWWGGLLERWGGRKEAIGDEKGQKEAERGEKRRKKVEKTEEKATNDKKPDRASPSSEKCMLLWITNDSMAIRSSTKKKWGVNPQFNCHHCAYNFDHCRMTFKTAQ